MTDEGRGSDLLGAGGDLSRDGPHLQGAIRSRADKARTELAVYDTVISTLEGSLTPAERRLSELGEDQRLRDTRVVFQHATQAQFCEVIERLLGRKVRAFISGMDTGKDVAAEVFYLED
jgi:uncharacterized protein YbcI